MPRDNEVLISKINFIESALFIGRDHARLLRHAVEGDDVDGIMRSREMLHNTLELFGDLMGEIASSLPDWRPTPRHPVQPDGNGDVNPDAHLGATEA